jgi:predicted transcriptional regulator
MTAFRELYRLKETKDKAIDELIERADFKQVSADTIREIIEGKNQSFNSKLDHGSMELLTRYIDDDKRLIS